MEKFLALLKKHNLKATPQRLAVHEAMTALGHADADAVKQWLTENSSTKVTVASIYNILHQMAELGIYSVCISADNKMYFDVTTAPHFHMYDAKNKLLRDVSDKGLQEKIFGMMGQRRFKGYSIERVEVLFVVKPRKRVMHR